MNFADRPISDHPDMPGMVRVPISYEAKETEAQKALRIRQGKPAPRFEFIAVMKKDNAQWML